MNLRALVDEGFEVLIIRESDCKPTEADYKAGLFAKLECPVCKNPQGMEVNQSLLTTEHSPKHFIPVHDACFAMASLQCQPEEEA